MYLNVEAMPNAKAMPSVNSSRRERHDGRADVKLRRSVDRLHDEVGLRIGQQEQADPRSPQHPPGDRVRAEAVRQPAAEGAQQAPPGSEKQAASSAACAMSKPYSARSTAPSTATAR